MPWKTSTLPAVGVKSDVTPESAYVR